ncbi:hybrid sensor histidine kinase/response regulator [[Clostridium] hylemonae]|uniref:hybrid sensor histidine kinase/response regulator n=1 Tax=[Clostridium] hylemonae TaxID=89153 RepID=UPI0039942605
MSENKTEKAGQTSSYDHDTQYFQMMMEEYDGNIYISDIETYDLLYLNQTACRSLDRHLEEIIGCKCYKVIQGRNDPCPFCTNDKLREDEYYEWEFYNPVLERTFMIKDRLINWNGRMARMELSHDMYTSKFKLEKKSREQERQRKMLEDAYKTARIASEAKTNFLSSMSHDIRTPMNAIMGMTAIAEANLYAPDKLKDCLSKINASAQHLLGLINEVLDMSKIESGKIDLTFGTVSLPELFQNISDMCRPLAQEKNQKLQLSVDDVCHKTVITDGGRLQQVLMNLLTNAIKYTPEGGAISLHVREIPSDAVYKGQYEFIVTDNGIGMTAEYIPHIFEPFSRAEDTRINKIQGTGLGLAITQNIVNMMNGTIEVQSEPESGSRFIVAVPLDLYRKDMTTSAQLKSQSVTPDEEAARLVEEEPPSSLSSRRILLVEDNDLNREIASELLEMHGCSIEAAENGKFAVEKFARSAPEEYDCILMDIQMPVMDGYEAARAIRALKRDDAQTVPILALTANAFATDLAKAHNAGMNDHIAKPIDVERLLETLNRWMV